MDIKKKEKDFRSNICKEQLIKLVEQRPVIWDKYLDNYKSKVDREAAWREICLELMPGFGEMRKSDRHLFKTSLIRSWTQLRDAWTKSLQPNRQIRPYVYHKKLLFLLKVVSPPKPRESLDSQSGCSDEISVKEENHVRNEGNGETEELDGQNIGNAAKVIAFVNRITESPSSQNMEADNEARLISFVDHTTAESRHMNFFKSLLPSLTSLDDDQILEFHSGVIGVLQSIKKKRSSELWEICVLKKWTVLRDSWMRSIEPNRQSRPYIYHNELLFLKKIIDPSKGIEVAPSNQTKSTENEEEVCYEPDQIDDSHEFEKEAKIISLMEPAPQDTENRHIHFLKSLLPTLTSFDDDQTLAFQSGVIGLLQNIKKGNFRQSRVRDPNIEDNIRPQVEPSDESSLHT